jgi:hypothetical protein
MVSPALQTTAPPNMLLSDSMKVYPARIEVTGQAGREDDVRTAVLHHDGDVRGGSVQVASGPSTP